jgi:hypothetical protein
VTTSQNVVVTNTSLVSWQTTTTLVQGHSYRWHVQAVNIAGAGAWSNSLSFSIAPLAAPKLIGPSGKSAGITPTFRWNAVTGADYYSIQVDDLSTGKKAVLSNGNVTGTAWTTPTALVPGHHYRWWMRAFTNTGAVSGLSSALSFVATLAAPILTGPVGPTSVARPTFVWDTVAGADHYAIWINDLTAGRGGRVANGNVVGTSWTRSQALISGHTYRFRVLALSRTGGASAWSSPLALKIV